MSCEFAKLTSDPITFKVPCKTQSWFTQRGQGAPRYSVTVGKVQMGTLRSSLCNGDYRFQ